MIHSVIMKRREDLFIRVSLSILFLQASIANACPANLEHAKTVISENGATVSLCAIFDRYEFLRQKLIEKGVNHPERIADILAPRFINGSDWKKAKTKSGRANPWTVYNPTITTWGNWEKGRVEIDALAEENFEAGLTPTFSRDEILHLHTTAMIWAKKDAGKLRDVPVIGSSISKSTSQPAGQLQRMQEKEYMTPLDGETLVTWTPKECVDANYAKLPLADRPALVNIPADLYFTDDNGMEHQCGVYDYTSPKKVDKALTAWVSHANRDLSEFSSHPAASDLVKISSKLQRWFVSIHPFTDGNGRMSRYYLDYILQSYGLPTPVLEDHNRDLYVREDQWAQMITQGMLRHLEILEDCVSKVQTGQCKQVKFQAPLMARMKLKRQIKQSR